MPYERFIHSLLGGLVVDLLEVDIARGVADSRRVEGHERLYEFGGVHGTQEEITHPLSQAVLTRLDCWRRICAVGNVTPGRRFERRRFGGPNLHCESENRPHQQESGVHSRLYKGIRKLPQNETR